MEIAAAMNTRVAANAAAKTLAVVAEIARMLDVTANLVAVALAAPLVIPESCEGTFTACEAEAAAAKVALAAEVAAAAICTAADVATEEAEIAGDIAAQAATDYGKCSGARPII
jgi:hypothetical protein